jgi:hypothetical protein
MTLEQLKDLLDQNFSEPFLPAGLVRTEMRDRPDGPKSLSVWIGRRDVDFTEDGRVIGAGTCTSEPMPEELRGTSEP